MKNSLLTHITAALSLFAFAATSDVGFGQATCANNNPGGNSKPCKDCPIGTGATNYAVDAYTGNETRIVHDLEVWGGTGEHQLNWTRYGITRADAGTNWFGSALNWRHGYQWDVSVATDSYGPSSVKIFYPDGTTYTFTRVGTSSTFVTTAGEQDVLSYNSSLNRFTLQRANGWQYIIGQLAISHAWRVTSFLDTQQNVYTLSYDSSSRLSQVTEPGGRYLKLTYQTLSLNADNFSTLFNLGGTPPASGVWTTITSVSTVPVRYVRYIGPDRSSCQVAELQYFTSGSSTPLSGTPFGSGVAPIPGNEPSKAFDGNTSTYFKSTTTVGDYVGYDLGTPILLSQIKFFPVVGQEAAMASGKFLGSNVKPSSIQVISRVDSSDGRSVVYNYQAINESGLPVNWEVLGSVQYGDGTQATYTYGQVFPDTRPLLTHAIDPRVQGPGTNLKWEYYTSHLGVVGYVQRELNGVTGETIVTLSSIDYDKPVAIYANGGTRTIYIDHATGRATSVKNTLGFTRTVTYDTNQYLQTIADELGNATQYTYTSHGNWLTRTNPDASVESCTRDSLDLILTHTNELGKVTTYTRDSQHRVTQITYPDSTFETFTYNSLSEVTSHQLRNGGTESNVYDVRGLKTSHTDPLGHVTTYAYDANDRLSTVTDARGNATGYTYNERGLVTKITNADSSFTAYGYDSFGNCTTTTNELGNTWTSVYDEWKRLVTATDPLSRSTTYSYDLPGGVCGCSHGNATPTKITLPSGKATTITYDTEWQKTSMTVGYGSADAATTSYAYDAAGELKKTTDPRGKLWLNAYDSRHRRISSTDPLSHITQWTYDTVGNNLTTTRPDGGVTTNVFDAMNRLMQSTDPKGEVTAITYDNLDNLLTTTDARSNVYSFTYDLLGRGLSMVYPDSSAETVTYDAVGNVATLTTRGGQLKTSTYDNRNRETAYGWSDATPGVARTYDAASRLLTANNGVSNLTYTYDAANQCLSETQDLTPVNPALSVKTIGYSYDLDGNRASLTYPAGDVESYTYTGRNQVATVSLDGPPSMAAYTYDLNGNRLNNTMEDTTTASYTYDNANRLTNLSHTVSGSSAPFASFGYAYNSVNKRTSRAETSGTNVPVTDNYTYDAIDQVAGVAYGAGRNVSYSYDSTGNRTSVVDSGSSTSYTANNLNQYTAVGSLPALTYDGNANLTGNNGWTYTYDAQNRLIKAVGPMSAVATFAYDSKNRCVSRTINGTATYYTYDHWSLIEDRSASDALQAYYVHGRATDEILAMISGVGSNFYHYDALGNVTRITNGTGQVVESYSYDVFGTPSITDGSGSPLTVSAIGNRFMFTGREYIQDLGLYDYRNRVYSPVLGRFLQTDPIRFDAGDVNIYRYVTNDPINRLDPLGLVDHSLFAPGSAAGKNAQTFNPSGQYSVGGHGTPQYIEDETGSRPAFLNPQELANQLLSPSSGYKKGTPVTLFACSTGHGDNSFAEQLANILGVPVTAPSDILWSDGSRTGGVIAPSGGEGGRPDRPDMNHQGSWRTFYPHK